MDNYDPSPTRRSLGINATRCSFFGDEATPTSMKTQEILTHPQCLQTTLSLLRTIQSAPNATAKIAEDFGLTLSDSSSKLKRNATCDLKLNGTKEQNPNQQQNDGRTIAISLCDDEENKFGTSKEDDEPNCIDGYGMELVQELVSRKATYITKAEEYVPKGDEFDLSDSSLCMLDIFPGYEENSRNYKKMKKRIASLTVEEISHVYDEEIRARLHEIIRGNVYSRRMNLYKEYTHQGKRSALGELRAENVMKPFTQEQIEHIVTLIGYDFSANPAKPVVQEDFAAVTKMDLEVNFPCYVLLPEALMSLFAKINHVTLPMAEEVMKWVAATDEKLPQID